MNLLEELKQTQKSTSVFSFFEDGVKRHPYETALVTPKLQLTFLEVHLRSLAVAAALMEQGVKPGHVVGVFLDRSVELVVAILALAKIGALYLPLDPLLNKSQILEMIHQGTPTLILFSCSTPHACLEGTAKLLSIKKAMKGVPREELFEMCRPDQFGYIIFTAGLKGLTIKQKGIINLAEWMKKRYRLSENDRTLQLARPDSDASIGEIFNALLNGVTLFIFPETRDPVELKTLIKELKITLVSIPTAIAELLFEEHWDKECALRYLFSFGETMRKRPPKELPFTVINTYGPSENCITSIEYEVKPETSDVPIPIGTPIPFVKALILDASFKPVKEGEIGELAIGGAGLTEGYLTEKASRRFIILSQLGKRQERYLLTGDAARFKNGVIQCFGKMERFTESGLSFLEIEAFLLKHPSVGQAAIKRLDNGLIAAYWSPKKGARIKEKAIKRALKERLKENDLPKIFIEMTSLPINKRGKIHYDQLPPPKTETEEKEIIVPALTAGEKELVSLFQEKLAIYPISTEKPIDEIPHTEEALFEIAYTLSECHEKRVTISDLIQNETIKRLALWIKEKKPPKPLISWISLVRKNQRVLCIPDDDEEIYPFLYIEELLTRSASFATLDIPYQQSKSLEEAVSLAIEEIKEANPTVLIGIGKGGHVASLIAASLGKPVALFLINSLPPTHYSLQKQLKRFLALPLEKKSLKVQDLWKAFEEAIIDTFSIEWPPGTKRHEKHYPVKEGALGKLLSSCSLPRYTSPAALITSEAREEEGCEWSGRFEKLLVKTIPGLESPFISRKEAERIASEIKHYLAW